VSYKDCVFWNNVIKKNEQLITVRMSDNLPERVQILGHAHIICITVRENRIICCQIFCDLLLKSAFERIFNVMQLILIQIKWHFKWKYLIQKCHDICLSYYFKTLFVTKDLNSFGEIIAQTHCSVDGKNVGCK
jgi:hypothetical protein